MHNNDYTFVTIDSDDALWGDAVMVDMNDSPEAFEAVIADEGFDASDFITLSHDTVLLQEADMLDIDSFDMGIDDSDISFMV